MTDVFTAAEYLRDALREAGRSALDHITRSTNRHGQNSAYIECGSHRYRVSDHPCNDHFRPAETSVHYAECDTPEKAKALVSELFDAAEVARHKKAEDKANAEAERDAREAPFRAKYLAAAEHSKERFDAIVECYGWMNADKAARREVARRWEGK